ncbi:MAG: 4-hydroxy-3-methylbut-2-enyl diphosphate reductase [Candidatus Neomarinimicrobiota bacterium]|nr:4-hydroxy-3-methylbut-2-enyl diphosphate reductase [Candidatus Neomarinimicrobiota bacterium]MEC9455417.1 4-hydroxy-3-methylbut-2-enyl diphosphate reductase [Candidatus Neomarinimicrobiota bacterium]MED5451407.1 4-hydroxy-3-methylbut-2-enyl diphosphate reductase [Candidatus Neomarinimicrobiota bacterium]MEE3242049.1 4-hydroxy-3-methylbut-2-enyl diphosphate reductase [Candidatus Neomarinimicrobiota bacterium]MEE3301869.1 4-hydroxy-3-methylbut-2-enyl diphosphate reductase [Candidatus Neomarini
MKIILAKDAGYCFGVRDAVNSAYDMSKEYGEVYMLGDIVHNESVVDDLEKNGVKVVSNLNQVPDDKPVLFRAHGTAKEVWKDAEKKKMNIIDATCPLVHEIHKEVKQLDKEGRKIIIIGDHGHDEVIGIASQVKDAIIISTVEEAAKLKKTKKAGIVSQSTQTIENVQDIISILMTKVFDLRFVNTICFPTKRNQEQIKELSKIVDLMIIIGSFTSANSKRLTQLSLERNKSTYQVTNATEIDVSWFKKNINSVGISAGASTPDRIINSVVKKVKDVTNTTNKETIYE